MKTFLAIIVVVCMFISCDSKTDNEFLQLQIDSLQDKIDNTYRPGLGEFMMAIQLHHAKLWFAGQNQNWPLADYEINEIKETLEDVPKYCGDEEGVKSIGMIDAPLDSIIHAIQQKNILQFKNSYILLTNTCNGCHKAAEHGFNVITIPTSLPVTNQNFKPLQ
jgi:hypothetical protein